MKKSSLILSILSVLIATALWFIGSWWYYTCKIKNTCGNTQTIANNSPSPEKTTLAATATNNAVTDTDNDGLTDEEEEKAGTDPLLVDTDGDSIPDNEEIGSNIFNPLDTDKDGIIDALDLDDDNDNTSTLLEEKIGTSSLLEDTDDDGITDTVEIGNDTKKPTDTDNDGIINALDTDDDDDGLSTSTEILFGTNPLLADTDGDGVSDGDEIGELMDTPKDTDADGTIDALDTEDDLDQDNDGLSDALEAQLNTDPKKADTDGDGIDDAKEVGSDTEAPIDTDLDGTIDALDTVDDSDSDNDGLTDAQELKLKSNPKEEDSDGDGINDNEEIGSNIDSPLDSDDDGILNLIDSDDDNDGLETKFEIKIGTNPLTNDTDNDGLSDKQELSISGSSSDSDKLQDTDNDGKIDPVDTDDDNDTLLTSLELSIGSNPLKVDSDGDGIDDGKEIGSDTDKPMDSDKDGIADILDSVDDLKTNAKTITKVESKPEVVKVIEEDKPEPKVDTPDSLKVEAIADKKSDAFQPSRLYFPSSSANPVMSTEASEYFDNVIAWMKLNPENSIELTGHTDATGKKQANLALGIRRVMVIREMLIIKGAPIQQIDIMSRGESQPIADNRTVEGRLKNRRIEIAPMEK